MSKGLSESVVLDTFEMMYHAGEFRPAPPQVQKMFESKGIDDSLHISIYGLAKSHLC